MKPTPEQMERAVAALMPYVLEWNLPLNPEHLYELAGAVLTHFDSATAFDAIDAAERARIEEFKRQQATLYRE
jgi:alcohol dehydrogenase class IV